MEDQSELVEGFVEFVKARDWVTFVELERFAREHGLETKGDLRISICPNGVLWANMSEELTSFVQALQADKRLMLDTGHWFAYLIDGGMLGLPVAKRSPRDITKGYAKERWIPTFFRPRAAL